MDTLEAFAILGLENDASVEDIKSAYRKFAKQWHPDLNKVPEAEEKFKQINQAYEILMKPKVRNSSSQFSNDLFEQFFGRQNYDFFGGGFSRASAAKSVSITFELEDVSQELAEEIAQIIIKKGLKIKGYSFTQRT